MTVPSVAAALVRIASIQTRFAAPGFAGALLRAQAGATATAAGPALAAPQPGPAAPAWGLSAAGAGAPAGAGAGRRAAPVTADGAWAQRLPEQGRPWAPAIARAAEAAGIDPALFAAVVWAESSFDPGAVSTAGARGLAQLMPGTARELGVDIADPAANLAGGARYLRAQLDRFGALDLALAAYNAGPGAVARAGGVPAIAETRAYVPRVLDHYARLQGAP